MQLEDSVLDGSSERSAPTSAQEPARALTFGARFAEFRISGIILIGG